MPTTVITGPAPARSPARHQARCRGDRGSAYATVLVFPLVIVIFMTFVQWALYFHAEALVNAATQDGARVAQAYDGTATAGKATADSALADATRSGLLTNLTINVVAGPTQVTATATADVPALVPLPLNRTVRATASGPKERLTGGTP
jgi:Flp pilus assembly protein TadG